MPLEQKNKTPSPIAFYGLKKKKNLDPCFL